jgi:NTE family protein
MKYWIALVFQVCMCVVPVMAQDTTSVSQRPNVGLVLAGGGARGASFIGVLKYLEELDIPIDYVVGSSMGSVVGGIYALGYSPDEMAEIISSVDWRKYVGNHIDRSCYSTDLRERYGTQVVNIPFNVRDVFKKGFIPTVISEFPIAYVNNREVENLLNELSQGYQDSIAFDDLPVPFACVATDIVAGEEVVLRNGSLPKAIRASMAIPVVFSPVVINGKLLYDGGLTNIFPSDVLREMGVDIVIGIEFSNEKYFYGNTIPKASKLFDYLYNFGIHLKRDENKKLCDILIKPKAAEFGPFSFTPEAIDTLVSRGYQAACQSRDALLQVKHLLDSVSGQPVHKRPRINRANPLNGQSIMVQKVVMDGENLNEYQVDWLKRRGKIHERKFVTKDHIRKAIELYRGTGAFDAVSYNLVSGDSLTKGQQLVFHLGSTVPDVVGLGARYDTEEGAALLFSMGLKEHSLSGLKLKLKGRLSFNPRINVKATYSLFSIANFSLAYEYRNQLMGMSVYGNDNVNLRMQTHEISGFVSQFQLLNIAAELGVAYASTSFPQVNLNDFHHETTDSLAALSQVFKDSKLFGPYFSIEYDNLDRGVFAKHGVCAGIEGHLRMDTRKKETLMGDMGFSCKGCLTPWHESITIIPQLYGRLCFDESLYVPLWNTIGGEIKGRHCEGQLPFVGINHIRRVGDLSTVLRCDLRYNIWRKHYFTAIYNIFLCFDDNLRKSDKPIESYSGFGLKYSYDSYIGPIGLTAQWSDINRQVSLYFSIGYDF